MAAGDDVVALARKHVGEKYVLGAQVTFADANCKGPWDCAEFATWVVYQATGMLIGCRPRRDSGSEAYTGFWFDDADAFGLEIKWRDALKMPGALLGRRAVSGKIGHIAIAVGNDLDVVEAAGANLGVREFTALERPWDVGIRLPSAVEWAALAKLPGGGGGSGPIFRASEPPGPARPEVVRIQDVLRVHGFDPGPSDGVFGAWTEKAVANFQNANGLIVDGLVGRQTGQALGLPFWGQGAVPPVAGSAVSKVATENTSAMTAAATPPGGVFNERYGVVFSSLVDGGVYSADPDDTSVKRAIRTNNPGALNVRPWQEKFPGYVGATSPDNSAQKNRTTIFRTPEHGIAAWYHLFVRRYGYGPDGLVRIGDLARRYAGEAVESDPHVQAYVTGWRRFSNNKLSADSIVKLNDIDAVVALARGMFGHEIGRPSLLIDGQIRYAVMHYRQDDLPS